MPKKATKPKYELATVDTKELMVDVSMLSDETVYFNATEMAKPFGKRPVDWLVGKAAKDYISQVMADLSVMRSELVRASRGTNSSTFLHEKLVCAFSRWLHCEASYHIDKHVVTSTIVNLVSSLDTHDLPVDRFVYVARESVSGRYKIGISKDPERRVKELNIGNPEELVLVHHYKATEDGHLSETLAHALFEEHRLRSEWFDKGISLALLPE